MIKILVVDDEAEIRSLLAAVLQNKGYEVVTVEDGAAALQAVPRERPAVILMDLSMPRMNGMDALPEIKRLDAEVPVIICTAHADLATAVRAMKLGAYDYLTKPFDVELLILTLERAVERHRLHSRIEELKRQGQGSSLAERMGGSPAIAQVIQQVAQVAESNFTVLVQGETGTGKELVARGIHQQSPRRPAPFVAVDCGAIPETLVESELFGHERGAFTGAQARREGHFQLAKGGTLFLDEIGNVPLATQAKLLRALEQREVNPLGAARAVAVDARIIAATNSELEESVKAGRFRADLYYRLSEFTIALPPLRSRREDIMHLSQRFLDEVSMELRRPVRRIADEAMQVLLHHDWPGNVRELRNVVRKAALLATDVVTPEHIPALSASAPAPSRAAAEPLGEDLSLREVAELAAGQAEREVIRHALESTKGNKSQAARLLRTDYTTLHAKMKRYGISARAFTPR
ncbi:MAG TPA: sigma-54 dependent transcriptional regulator [Candidatus Dormibacteraeota bacterium]|nr:sigma-54 dependent transcriptional regulator [Candidatus Dormibacteraeota bacterium]